MEGTETSHIPPTPTYAQPPIITSPAKVRSLFIITIPLAVTGDTQDPDTTGSNWMKYRVPEKNNKKNYRIFPFIFCTSNSYFPPPPTTDGPCLLEILPYSLLLIDKIWNLKKNFYLLIWGGGRKRERIIRRGRERNIDLLFHLFIHSLVDSCMCPDQELNLQPWYIQMTL